MKVIQAQITWALMSNFKITTSWAAFYTYGYVYTTAPGEVHGFGFDDYRCR